MKKFLDKIGFETPMSEKYIFDHLKKYYPKKEAAKIKYSFDAELRKRAREEEHAINSHAIYDIINQSLEASLCFGIGQNYYRYIHVGEKIKQNSNLFKGTVLDIGCMNGVLTCYLAYTFPEINIVGIDSDEKAVTCAEELASKLGLTNVEFVSSDLENFSGEYDVIFSSFVLHEIAEMPFFHLAEQKNVQIEASYNNYREYATKLSSLLKQYGKVLLYERMMSGYIAEGLARALEDSNLDIATSEIYLNDYDADNAIILTLTKDTKANNYGKCLTAMAKADAKIKNLAKVEGQRAINRICCDSSDLLYGVQQYVDDKLYAKAGISKSVSDRTAVYTWLICPGKTVCYCYDISQTPELLVSVKQDMIKDQKSGIEIIEIYEM